MLIQIYFWKKRDRLHGFKAKRNHTILSRYKERQKRCNTFEIFIKWDETHCPCCNYKLRARLFGGFGMRKYYREEAIKRCWTYTANKNSVLFVLSGIIITVYILFPFLIVWSTYTFINQEKSFSRSLLIRFEVRKIEREGHLGYADNLMSLLVIMSIPTISNGSPDVIFYHIHKD